MPTFYEFFAGGGMARAGLGDNWLCLFANDFSAMKGAAYTENWGGDELVIDDIANLTTKDMPGVPDLVWGSSPCQDLSLAGKNEGLGEENAVSTRSGTFWHYWSIVRSLRAEGRAPKIVVLENVCGAITSHEGKDFAAIATAFANTGYRFGAVVIDASLFVPQSRKRLFVIGIREDLRIPGNLVVSVPSVLWHSPTLQKAQANLSQDVKDKWLWWDLPAPKARKQDFIDILEDEPTGVEWHSLEDTCRLLSLMNDLHREKVEKASASGRLMVGGIYKRIRGGQQRAEIRFDNISGCLRTPSGGSSRQVIMLVKGKEIRSRLLSPREGARLMGLQDTYKLPAKYNDAYHLAGDGVVVQVVDYLNCHIFEPLLREQLKRHKDKPQVLVEQF